MPDLTIRPIAPGDADDWRRLWTAYLEFYEASVPEAVYAATFKRLCNKEKTDQNGLLALLDARPVGLVHYIFHAHNWKVEEVCYLQDLYADPEVRGTGVGRALIEAVYTAADAAGKPSVYWLTQEFNATARRLYDRIANVTPFIVYRR
ncbi:GNAT family N-acetyltransferase [Marimonas arenosa]|uniref:GNAT family N-acetyltransferase n=1 Tax=Marimonas arenosa TaxID=1795305 RepID=A0AAE3WF45_9RHOB|nr:GNAT family N-acetyltransferase [Marimonas arenosa]MDQ2092116.1 GNAT family N-acetyltransferase [Marimonas arenosa]